MIDYVTDFLYDDLQSLRSCTLVNRQWLPAGSFHLFRRIHWPPCDRQRRWSVADHGDGCAKCHLIDGSGTLQSIVTLFSTSLRAATSVRELYIKMVWYGPNNSNISTVTTPQQLAHIVGLLPCLETLDVQPMQFRPSSFSGPLPAGPRLRVLHLTSPPSGIDLESMLIFVSHFSSISKLSLSPVISEQRYPVLGPPAQALHIRVNELDLVVLSAARVWFEFLSSHLDLSYLTSLSHSPPAFRGPWAQNLDDSIPALHNFIRKCTNLRLLTCRNGFPAPGILSYPSTCTTLNEIDYHVGHIQSGFRMPTLWSYIADLLKCRLASTVTAAVIQVTCTRTVYSSHEYLDFAAHQTDFVESFGSIDWPVLNDAIRRLQSLRMEVGLLVAKGQREWERIETPQENDIPDPDMWRETAEACRAGTEAFIRNELSIASHQRLELDVSLHATN
ncbi:hypothetical protein PsYK624_125170 [Phanerochaete sordida]|uniref:F-box domain-containing protein n=1 Tax=Phanerochaete sordida TaxID=48140 RepID=A0A9P3GJZ0_9APHY|nr:hypothetical protein PsYK624_125170 [Phanerochaete sordida]